MQFEKKGRVNGFVKSFRNIQKHNSRWATAIFGNEKFMSDF